MSRKSAAVELDQDVAFAQAGALGGAARIDRSGDAGAVGAAPRPETKLRPRPPERLQYKAGAGQIFGAGELICAGNVPREKLLEVAPCDFFSRGADVGAISIKAAAPGEVLIERAQDVVEARAVVGGIANQDIEQHADELAFVVVGDAELRPAVERVFLEPRIEAGLLDAFPAARGPQFELGNLASQILIKLLSGPQAAAHQSVGAVGAGDSLGEPQGACPLLARVVHRLERGRPDALDVPQVKEFVGRDAGERTN